MLTVFFALDAEICDSVASSIPDQIKDQWGKHIMKFDGKTLKIALAVVVMVGAAIWAVSSVLPRSYAGTNLNIAIGSGPVNVTNPSGEDIPVQVVSVGTRVFRVTSTTDGVSGASVRQGTGNSSTQLFEFGLPPGSSEFTVTNGSRMSFVANTQTKLAATVQPMTTGEANTTLMVGALIVLGALVYISRATDHRWIDMLRGQKTLVPELTPVIETAASRQGPSPRSYGDNRADTSD